MHEGKRRTALLTAMCGAVLVVQLDTTIVNLALRPIQRALHADVVTLQWVIDAYNLAYGTLILSGAILGDRFGRKRAFLAGVAIFAAGSIVSAIAPNAALLVASRIVTGIGAALALPLSLAIVAQAYPAARERAHAIAVWGGTNGVAIALGPTLGGFLVDRFGWRSIFVLFVPAALATFAAALTYARESTAASQRGLDLRGQLLAIAALGLLTFGIIEGPRNHWNGAVVAALAASALAALVFVTVERRVEQPLVELAIFKRRAFSAAIAVTMTMTFGMYGFLFLIPNYLQSVVRDSALAAGVALLPLGAVFAALSPLAGRIAARTGARALVATGQLAQAAGLFWCVSFGKDVQAWIVFADCALLGFALACETGPLMAVAVAATPADRFGMSSGIVNVARIAGATIGVAVLGAILSARIAARSDAAGFLAGMHAALAVGASAALAGALVAATAIARDALGTARGREAAA